MNFLLLVSAAAGFASAIGHSVLSEKILLAPLFRHRGDNPALAVAPSRRIVRRVFHLPSLVWAQTAAATAWFAAGAPGSGRLAAEDWANGDWANAALPAFAIFGAAIYLTAATANAEGLRRVHIGNVLLTIAGAALLAGAL